MTRDERTRNAIQVLERLFKDCIGWPDYEVVVRRSYESFLKPGDVVVDIGAHSGTHLEHFLRRVGPAGRVIAFEPLPDLCAGLVETFHPDGVTLVIHQMALGRVPDPMATFVRADGSLPESGLRERVYNSPATVSPRGITVAVETLDRMMRREGVTRLDYVKMDVEGGELDVIEGGLKTIAQFRPVISVEHGHQAYSAYGHREDSLFETAARIGYMIHDPFLQNIGSRELWDDAKARYCWDYFLVPAERCGGMKSLLDA